MSRLSDPSPVITPQSLPFQQAFKGIYSAVDQQVTIEFSGGRSHVADIKAGATRPINGERITAATSLSDLEVHLYKEPAS